MGGGERGILFDGMHKECTWTVQNCSEAEGGGEGGSEGLCSEQEE